MTYSQRLHWVRTCGLLFSGVFLSYWHTFSPERTNVKLYIKIVMADFLELCEQKKKGSRFFYELVPALALHVRSLLWSVV